MIESIIKDWQGFSLAKGPVKTKDRVMWRTVANRPSMGSGHRMMMIMLRKTKWQTRFSSSFLQGLPQLSEYHSGWIIFVFKEVTTTSYHYSCTAGSLRFSACTEEWKRSVLTLLLQNNTGTVGSVGRSC